MQMIEQGRGGRIIGATSLAGKMGTSDNFGECFYPTGHIGTPGACSYSASKFAIRGLTQVAGDY
jgi:NAD(P)-dependent dehydrogenase (short-subunit alcohol dehydrogenase family)